MKLRTVKRPSRNELDEGSAVKAETAQGKNHQSKENTEREVAISSNDNSNLGNEFETRSKHKLRNSSNNYQGKYKNLNSGKYLYKMSGDKKPVINKKKQLKFFSNELVSYFRKFLTELNKREDEQMLLSKKKRREEKDHKTKLEYNQNMKFKFNGKMPAPGMPYDQSAYFYQNPHMLERLRAQGYPVDYYGINSKKPFTLGNFMQMMPPEIYAQQGLPYPPYSFPLEEKNRGSIFNLISDKENLNRINKIANEGVNHIVAAFYIKSIQQRKSQKNEGGSLRRASVPVSEVNLNEGNDDKPDEVQREYAYEPTKDDQEKMQSPVEKAETDKNNLDKLNFDVGNIFNDKYTQNINELTHQQLSSVSDLMKKIKGDNISKIIEKDNQQNK